MWWLGNAQVVSSQSTKCADVQYDFVFLVCIVKKKVVWFLANISYQKFDQNFECHTKHRFFFLGRMENSLQKSLSTQNVWEFVCVWLMRCGKIDIEVWRFQSSLHYLYLFVLWPRSHRPSSQLYKYKYPPVQ